MLKRIKKLQQPLCAALLDKPREVRPLLPKGEEWTIIKELLDVHVLKPFHKATKTMSASSYPTLNMLSPLLYQLKVLVLSISENDSVTTKQFKQAVLLDLQNHYPQDIQSSLDMSAFLDPRFKDLDQFVDSTDRVDVEEAVKFEALELAEESDTIEAVVINVDDTLEETSSESQQQSPSDIELYL